MNKVQKVSLALAVGVVTVASLVLGKIYKSKKTKKEKV